MIWFLLSLVCAVLVVYGGYDVAMVRTSRLIWDKRASEKTIFLCWLKGVGIAVLAFVGFVLFIWLAFL